VEQQTVWVVTEQVTNRYYSHEEVTNRYYSHEEEVVVLRKSFRTAESAQKWVSEQPQHRSFNVEEVDFENL